LNGPAHTVKRQVAHREALPCSKCKKAQEEALFIEQCEADALANAEMGLPELTGTASQVAYAEKIRRRAALDTTRRAADEQECIDTLALATEAKWWIDNKEANYSEWRGLITARFGA
jgi:hypothetical protein